MPYLKNTSTYMSDGGGSSKKNSSAMYGSNYGGISSGKTGSSLGVYGVTPLPTNTRSSTTSSARSGLAGDPSIVKAKVAEGKPTVHGGLGRSFDVPDTPSTGGGYISGGSGGGSGSGSYSGGYSQTDDVVDMIKRLLNEQYSKANEYYTTLLNQALASNRQQYESDQDQINRNYKRAERYIRGQYGDAISGSGLTNRVRNNQNWINNIARNRMNYTNNDNTARADYNRNLANASSQLAQGWYNYVLPVYTNRQTQLDNLSFADYVNRL